MQLITPFNAHNVDPVQSIGSLPVGKHLVVIEHSEIKGSKPNAKGQVNGLLRFVLRVIEDTPHKGETGQYILNIYHSGSENSAKTVEIANQKLSGICHVTGVFALTDTTQLHNIPFYVDVVSQNNPENPTWTEIKRVFDQYGNEPVKGQGPRAPQGPQATQPIAPQPAQQPAQPPQGNWPAPPPSQPQQPPQPAQQPAAAWNQPAPQPQPNLQAIQGGAPPWGAAR